MEIMLAGRPWKLVGQFIGRCPEAGDAGDMQETCSDVLNRSRDPPVRGIEDLLVRNT